MIPITEDYVAKVGDVLYIENLNDKHNWKHYWLIEKVYEQLCGELQEEGYPNFNIKVLTQDWPGSTTGWQVKADLIRRVEKGYWKVSLVNSDAVKILYGVSNVP